MTLEETLIYSNVQVQIDKAAKKYRNKKILIYGTGLLSQKIFQNYDLSSLNIVGIVDMKFHIKFIVVSILCQNVRSVKVCILKNQEMKQCFPYIKMNTWQTEVRKILTDYLKR